MNTQPPIFVVTTVKRDDPDIGLRLLPNDVTLSSFSCADVIRPERRSHNFGFAETAAASATGEAAAALASDDPTEFKEGTLGRLSFDPAGSGSVELLPDSPASIGAARNCLSGS